MEQVGLEVEIYEPIDVWHYVKSDFQLVGINFLCKYEKGEVVLSEEHEKYEWLTLEDIISRGWKYREQYVKAFEKWNQIKN